MAQALTFRGDPVDSTFSLPLLAQLYDYLQPFAHIFPDLRLFRRFVQAVKGVIAAGVPIISRMAAAVLQSRDPRRTFHVAKRFYRWLTNPRFHHRALLKRPAPSSRTKPNLIPPSSWTLPIWRNLMAMPLRLFPPSRPPGHAPGLAVGEVLLPGHGRPYWLVVSEVYGLNQRWILLTNVPVTGPERVWEVWQDYRRRWRIEETFRFLQEEGLRIEDFRVLSLEAIRRLVQVVLIDVGLWVDEAGRQTLLVLGGKLGLKGERDGPYLVLRGMQKILNCLSTLAVLKRYGQLDFLLQLLDAL